MNLSIGWKIGLIGLIVIAAVIYLFSGPDSGGYRPPQISSNQGVPDGGFYRAKYKDSLKSMKIGRWVAKVEKGLSDHEVRLQAAPLWLALGETARLRSARSLWNAWMKIHPPSESFRTRIVIVDERGTKIGGSRLLDPSKIWVRKN